VEPIGDKVRVYNSANQRLMRENILGPVKRKQLFYRLIMVLGVLGIWELAANSYNSDLMLPPPGKTLVSLAAAVHDPEVLTNLFITLRRVLTGFFYALMLGVPIGFLMGYSKVALHVLEPLIDSVRQVPIMAWVPLTIVWFGLGDGPTIFLIAFSGTFPVILNTIAGVQGISKDYYHAARSMGAGPWSIFAHVIVPGALPDILTGSRIAVGMGWMSVI